MATLRFEPLATQLGQLASAALLFPEDVLEGIRLGQADPAAESADWPAAVREFMLHHTAVIRAAKLLLGAPQLERLARLHDQLNEEYQPGGPPKSPVYHSYLVQHVLGELPQGLGRETPYSVVARLSSGDAARARLQEVAQSLASAHLDLYRVTRASPGSAELTPLRGGEAFTVLPTGPFLQVGDRILGRVVAFAGSKFMADSPYLLEASDADWLEHLARVAAAAIVEREASSAVGGQASGKPKLTVKQAARRRKEQKLKEATQHSPNEAVLRYLRHGVSERYWLEYILTAYAGERNGIVRLAGVPDRPETLPHAGMHEPA
jgi:hypothetical protein